MAEHDGNDMGRMAVEGGGMARDQYILFLLLARLDCLWAGHAANLNDSPGVPSPENEALGELDVGVLEWIPAVCIISIRRVFHLGLIHMFQLMCLFCRIHYFIVESSGVTLQCVRYQQVGHLKGLYLRCVHSLHYLQLFIWRAQASSPGCHKER